VSLAQVGFRGCAAWGGSGSTDEEREQTLVPDLPNAHFCHAKTNGGEAKQQRTKRQTDAVEAERSGVVGFRDALENKCERRGERERETEDRWGESLQVF
jgi:hypothetical protein